MPDSFDYTTGTNSENVRLLQALIDDAPEYTEETNSRNANILKSIINNTEYTDAPQSEIEELLLRLKAKIGGEIEVDELNVTENGTYDAGVNKAYNPVNVELPLSSKTITENGTYTASDDNLAGYDEVTVAVEGYAKKSIENTPTPIATFNASALPMPSLTVGIEAQQDLHGYDNPWPAGGGKNKLQVTATTTTKSGVTFTVKEDGTIVVTGTKSSSSSTRIWFDIAVNISFSNDVILNGCPSGGSDTTYKIAGFIGGTGTGDYSDIGNGVTIPANTMLKTLSIGIAQQGNISLIFKPMIRLASVTDASYAPYSNICPISGWSAVNVVVSPTTDAADGTTYTTTLKDGQGNPMECYGGELSNENGVQTLALTHGYIASYNGETLPSTWISDRDVYAEGTAPTTGAEVVYTLATPQTIPQDNLAIASQDGINNLWADSGDIQSGEYLEAL